MHLPLIVPAVVLWIFGHPLAAGGAATANAHPPRPDDLRRHVDAARDTVVTGSVQLEDGTPVQDAVIVTAFGGKAVSGHDGSFAITLPTGAASGGLDLTAVAQIGGTARSGTRRFAPAAGASIDDGAITLAASGGCDPSWLPTFGQAPGVNGSVLALAVFDDGAGDGPALYAGGSFTIAGGEIVNRVARWSGTHWSPLGAGVNNWVRALAVYDSGGGPMLYAGGEFTLPAPYMARWDGASWSNVGGGSNAPTFVNAMATYDAGGGPHLYAGGGSGLSRWNGTSWSLPGGGIGGSVFDLIVHNDGGGPGLYVTGAIGDAGGMPARSTWGATTSSPAGDASRPAPPTPTATAPSISMTSSG